jgi:hypothetical protein
LRSLADGARGNAASGEQPIDSGQESGGCLNVRGGERIAKKCADQLLICGAGLLKAAEKLQDHNAKLIKAIRRTEEKLLRIGSEVAKEAELAGQSEMQ